MTTRTEMLEILTDENFETTEDGTYETWWDRGPIRVIVSGTHSEELDEVTIHVFTRDVARLLVWSASFTPGTPTIVIQSAVEAAVTEATGTYKTPFGRVTIPEDES